jgi:cyclic dehypoxanthinyl futalosine synthase
MDEPLEKALAGEPISEAEAVALYRQADLATLALVADRVRARFHDDGVVTYIIDRNLNPTNVCVTDCGFCAFYRPPDHPEAYVLPREVIYRKVEELIAAGGVQLLLQGGHHPYLSVDWFADLFRDLKSRFPSIWIHGMSPPEIVHLAALEKTSVREVIRRLKDAGLDSIPGGGAEILVDRVRDIISPKKATTAEWLDVMRQAAREGLRGTATMMFGHVETIEERFLHLRRIRDLQEETGGVFTSFIPWTFQPGNNELGTTVAGDTTSSEYLRMIACSRIFLHNVENVQASFVTQGVKICQDGLAFGANDFGSVMLEENVVSQAGCYHLTTVAEIERHIRDAGFVPRRRDMLFRYLETPELAGARR